MIAYKMIRETSKRQTIIAIIRFKIKATLNTFFVIQDLDYIKMRVCGIVCGSCMNVKYVLQKY